MENINQQVVSFLVEKGLIQKIDLEKVFQPDQSIAELSIEESFINSGLLSREQFRSAAEEFFGVPFANQEDFPTEPLLINDLSPQFMKESKFVPSRLMGTIDKQLTVIMNNPLDYYTVDAIRVATNYEIRVLAGKENEILEAIEKYYG